MIGAMALVTLPQGVGANKSGKEGGYRLFSVPDQVLVGWLTSPPEEPRAVLADNLPAQKARVLLSVA